MAPETVMRGKEGVQVRLKKIKLALRDKTMFERIGAELKGLILLRTSKGEDVDGNAFESYSTPYAKIREKVGLPTDKVDLFFTGQMLSALSYTAEDDRVTMFFLNTSRKTKTKKKSSGEEQTQGSNKLSSETNASIAFYVNELRPFFALSKEEIQKAEDIVQENIRDALQGI